MIKLAAAAIGLSGGSLISAASSSSGFTTADLSQLIVAVTGLVAAISAFVLGMRSRKEDPRDKLLEMLLEERKEAIEDEPEDPEPKASRRRRRKP